MPDPRMRRAVCPSTLTAAPLRTDAGTGGKQFGCAIVMAIAVGSASAFAMLSRPTVIGGIVTVAVVGGRRCRSHFLVVLDTVIEGADSSGLELVEQPHEQAGMMGLLPHLVKGVGDPGAGQLTGLARAIPKPAIRTASKRIPSVTIAASSSRASLVRCTALRSIFSPATLSSSSGSS